MGKWGIGRKEKIEASGLRIQSGEEQENGKKGSESRGTFLPQ